MKILGNRVLVSRVEEEKKDGFQTVEVQDSFVYKGRVEQVPALMVFDHFVGSILIGEIILFAKNSPDTHEIDVEGKKMKVVMVNDIIAIL